MDVMEVVIGLTTVFEDEVFTNRNGGDLRQIIGNDIGKASVGVLVSVLFALGLQPLIAWSSG